MKKIIPIVIILAIIVTTAIYLFQKPSKTTEEVLTEKTGPGDFYQKQTKPEITFKKAMEPKTYENDKMSFALYYESELGVLDIGTMIEIYNKNDKAAEELAGGNINIQTFINTNEETYEQHIQGLISQRGKRYQYEFPESEKNLRDIKSVEYVSYPPSDTVVYFVSWENNDKNNYVTISSDNYQSPKKDNEIIAIINTIELKK